MIREARRNGTLIALTYETDFAEFAFGAAAVNKDQLATEWPDRKFLLTKQVHGTRVEEAPFSGIPEADGQFSSSPGLALTVQTADCVPILLASPTEIAALHAGWRGAAKGIVKVAAQRFSTPPQVALIGPHIQFSSFEVGRDVADQILTSAPASTAKQALISPHKDPNKVYFNLRELIAAQILSYFPQIHILRAECDTLTDLEFHSFRRDGERAGRQYSFVMLKR